MTPEKEQLLEDVESIKAMLGSRATGGTADDREYQRLRKSLLDDPLIEKRLPRIVRSYRSLDEFWVYIKPKFPHYSQRLDFLSNEFDPLLTFLEQSSSTPSDEPISEQIDRFDSESVRLAWEKALERRSNDPEGAITIARTLLEGVCKHVLEEEGIEYGKNPDLPELYKAVADRLSLSPSQHAETVFRQILGGCSSIIGGLGALRNKLGDSHGQGKKAVRPAPRHAGLAVNLAGTMATFLLATVEARKQK